MRINALVQWLIFLGILIALNILANSRFGNVALYGRLDLTEEKRFTLTEGTRDLLRDLDEVVYVQVLLEGEMPASFKRLRLATREILEDFRARSTRIEFSFENITEGDPEEVNQRTQELAQVGIVPRQIRVQEGTEFRQQLIYPVAVVNYKGRSLPVNLLENDNPTLDDEIDLNNSVALLEYKLANAIEKLQNPLKRNVLFTTGHGELGPRQTADLEASLNSYYNTGRLLLDSLTAIREGVDALIIAKPTRPFSERDKFKIDQYVMNGGKVLWLIDPLRIDLDSLSGRKDYVPVPYELELDDLLFRYGIRLEPNLVLDLQNTRIPLATGMTGDGPQLERFPYPYHVVTTFNGTHPVIKGLGPVNLFYPATLDTTVRAKYPLTKTVLVESTENTRLQYAPVRMNFEFLRYGLDEAKFNSGVQPMGMLLEGTFSSLYENRVTDDMMAGLDSLGQPFRAQSPPSAMLVIADGDVAENPVGGPNQEIRPLGYNPFEQYTFANKDLLMNAVEYMLDEGGIIEARGKEVRLRLLNTAKAKREKTTWQFVNIALPLVFLGLVGAGYTYWRRRRYGQPRRENHEAE